MKFLLMCYASDLPNLCSSLKKQQQKAYNVCLFLNSKTAPNSRRLIKMLHLYKTLEISCIEEGMVTIWATFLHLCVSKKKTVAHRRSYPTSFLSHTSEVCKKYQWCQESSFEGIQQKRKRRNSPQKLLSSIECTSEKKKRTT